ncbi:Vba1p KNAG_0E02560 [Huiozyma naganishii CBS 8797]|uniref:Major facilitator superfamily (MFS) profile domain-containing protein n=1 Tax=Huiozyma naganishii (strain ATCC MYA-139 / BCRC 22969 / CBS 8797 / KCTC 17520 / NBRC 10181 / NCYC 3082 / Yp74L-3) TaxID=1071383 RepID=J7R6P5_HUIN7|nr:hypothetical protein KNAG_0E02560 [Kazachstania naganishii CBS 8797]CCK70515.1 hypothetical protein KNAG_0E02560 [Kazachstania naganishii CBS 8797]
MEALDETTSLLPDPVESCPNDLPDDTKLEQEYHRDNMALPKGPILLSLWLGSFVSALDGTVVANIMNSIAAEFAESDKKQWIATSYLLTNTAFQPLYGKLSDITGRKVAVITAHFFFALGCLLTCFAQNVTQFSIARAICGIGGGGINAMSSITVTDICSARERGVYQGYANVVFGTGQLLGAPIGGFLLDSIGWRSIFGIQVPMLMLCSVLALKNVNIKLVHIPPRNERFTWKNLSRIDIFGSISLVATISGILFLTSSNWNKSLLGIFTVLSFSLFIYIELYVAKERIMPFELLKGSFGLSSIATVITSFIIYGEIFRSPIYLQLIQNVSVTVTGLYLIFPSVAIALGSIVTGSILRNTKMDLAHCAAAIIFGGMIMQLAGLALSYYLLSHVNPALDLADLPANLFSAATIYFVSDSIWWKIVYVGALVIGSSGYASLLVATLVSIVFTVDRSKQGTITGIFYLWRSIGNVLGASITLVVFERSLGRMLWEFMFGDSSTTGSYRFKKSEYRRLISDSSYLRKGPFPAKALAGLLKVYNKAFLISYVPNMGLSILGILVAWMLYRSHGKKMLESSAN